jgi:hypothetical protein
LQIPGRAGADLVDASPSEKYSNNILAVLFRLSRKGPRAT